MTSYSSGGYFNPAYHDSETLEIDRRSSSKTHHTNPYAGEDPAWRGDRAETHNTFMGQSSGDDAFARVPRGGWQEESWRGRESIPMGLISTRPGSPSWQHGNNHSTFQINPDSQYDRSPSVRFPPPASGHMTMRWRGMTRRRMSMFPNTDLAHLALTEDAIRNEMENEEQDLVKEFVALSTRDRIRAIRDLPMSFEEKKHIRSQVLAFRSSKQSRQFTCFADCSENVSLFFRRCGYSIRSARQTLELWQGIMKEIGGKFGTSVLSYFVFLKWLLMFNIFSFLVNFGFITIPLLVYDPLPNIPPNVSFRGLEILTGAGYFNHTVMYYGGYSNETLVGLVEYNMQLAYFFTIAVYMVLCGLALIFSMARSFKTNYVLAESTSNGAWQLLCSWDFSITNERAVRQRKSNLRVQLKESLSEKAQMELLTLSEKLKHFGVHLGSWLLSTGLAVGCGASIYYLCQYEQQRATDGANWSPLQEAETLLVPFVVSLMNLVVPLFYSLFYKFEHYSSQRTQIYALVVRNVLLRMSILGVLCFYWMNVVAKKFSCWESRVGQALYRLVIVDFLFLMLGSFFGEFLSNVIGTRLLPRLGVPEFDIARNVLELIYAQTLAWIGIYFSPLLPAIQIVKFFILFYLKKVSLTQNCQPPRRTGRAAQMHTTFIALLFFPFFVGALSMVAYTSWSLTPSEQCGPFRGLNNTFSVVGVWIDDLEEIPGSQWVVWIYQHVIRSELFYFLITLIILVIMYIFWQVTQGRKDLIGLLRQQIVNEGKDKSFLLDKLQNFQKSHPNKKPKPKNPKKHTKRRSDDHSSGSQSNSNAMVQALLARQRLEEEEERRRAGGVLVPSDISTSSAMMQAMLARQRAEDQEEDLHQMPDKHPSSSSALTQAMQARQRAEGQDEYYSTAGFSEDPVNGSSAVIQAMKARQRSEEDGADDRDDPASSVSSVMMQVMQARQRAEEEDRIQWVPAPPQNLAPSGSSALIQAMLARQQAQNEYDDGY
ncbi:transmembrane channel-like protein 5 isoform X1 [Seriola dumerili]|uniref:transmembrane channel-like protein 5 isoform X1 n=1 Tax=Seriola dumerili TaxID=41447 RepID=UPI000BBE45C9|nr:transmembrane channel-like protein 5 isoform X1 [Seriola dumerili]